MKAADYAFTHDVPLQRVVFASGAVARVGDEIDRLKISRVLIVATPGSGERLGKKVHDLLGPRAAALHAQAVISCAESGSRWRPQSRS